MFLIDKKISVDKPLTLKSITKYGNVLLQFTTARLITNYDNVLLQFTIAWLLQFSTTVITIYDRYSNLRRLLLQFTTEQVHRGKKGWSSRLVNPNGTN